MKSLVAAEVGGDAVAWPFSHQSNFTISGYGATILIDDAVAFSSAMLFFDDNNFVVQGVTVQGSRATVPNSDAENVAIEAVSLKNFQFKDLHFTGNFGGNGAGFAGDWLINGGFYKVKMDAVAQCYDVAFLQNVSIDGTVAVGAGNDGGSGADDVGSKCLSVIQDGTDTHNNLTGVSIPTSTNVSVTNNDVSNFTAGAIIQTGSQYYFSGNNWHDNPGTVSGALGIGLLLTYSSTLGQQSTGYPVQHVIVSGDRFVNNGTAQPAYGLLVDAGAITNSDSISDITVNESIFDNNHNTGVGAGPVNHIFRLALCQNLYTGSLQTLSMESGAVSINRGCRSTSK